jgi:hypothetical protein
MALNFPCFLNRLITLFMAMLAGLPLAAHAQQDTAHHREVYAEINENLKSYRYTRAMLEADPVEVQVEGWADGASLRKMVVTIPGDHGIGHEAYYMEGGELLFVHTRYETFNTLTGAVAVVVVDRYYFNGGRLVKWLGRDKQVMAPGSRDFAERAKTIKADLAVYADLLAKAQQGAGGARAPIKGEILEHGSITNIEDAPHPMYLVTVKIKKTGAEKRFLLNLEDPKVHLRMDDLMKARGKAVVFYYTSELERMVMDIRLNGRSLHGENAPILDPAWGRFTGILGGAESESGDLASEVTVTGSGGKRLRFEVFVDPETASANGKTVTVCYQPRRMERITHLQRE